MSSDCRAEFHVATALLVARRKGDPWYVLPCTPSSRLPLMRISKARSHSQKLVHQSSNTTQSIRYVPFQDRQSNIARWRGKPSAEAKLRRKEKNEAKRARKRDDEQQQELSRLPSSSSRLPSLPTTHGSFPASHHRYETSDLLALDSLSSRASDRSRSQDNNQSKSYPPDETITMANKKKPRAKSLASTHVARHMEEEAEACS
jgi:hypothetical protein